MSEKRLRALFLYNGERSEAFARVQRGEGHSAGFWGLVHLPLFGIDAEFLEYEQFFSKRIARFLRRYLFRSVYFLHAPFLPLFLRYDIIFTSSAFGTQLLFTLLHLRRPVWIMHDFSIASLVGSGATLKQRVFKYLVARSAGIVTVGKEETDRLKVLFPKLRDRIVYIPFGVDLDFFSPREVPDTGTVLAVGFDPDRDWKTLVEAVRGTDLSVVIATRPSRLAGIELPPNVMQKTFSQQELIEAYASAQTVVIPMDTSKGVNDAMGCSTLFEAMSMARPIVGTNTHTFASYITDGENGLLVPERDPVALREALLRVANDRELRSHLGTNARRYAQEYLDVVMLTKRLASFMKQIAQ